MELKLTAVINIHREGLWAHKAIRSAVAALEKWFPEPGSPDAEILVVADRADDETMDVVRAARPPHGFLPFRIVQCDVGDLGRARNIGVQNAKGKYVAFLDGDDVWSEDWPGHGVEMLEQLAASHPTTPAVAHPVLNVDFGDGAFYWTQPDQRADDFDPATFWNTNCWSSGSLSPRKVLIEHPYGARTDGLGFEDWEWNARTMAAGVLHVAVPKTMVFIRKKNDGLNVDSAAKHQLVRHSSYFESRPREMPRHKAIPFDAASLSIDEEWLLPLWKAAHRIEPALWPDVRSMARLPRYRAVPLGTVAALACQIYDKLKAPPTHIILAPCLVKGGADKRVVEYAAAVARAGGSPLVLLTDRDDDPSWASAIPDAVHAINISSLTRRIGPEVSGLALARLIMRFAPVLHIVNSKLGYSLLARYGRAIRDSGCPKIFCSLYGSEESEGKLGGAAFNGMFYAAHKRIDFVLSDNLAHLQELQQVHGWPLDKSEVALTPVEQPEEKLLAEVLARRAGKAPGLRVLWASRMVKGKRPDRLLAIAKLAHEKKLPIFFSVAGAPLDAFSNDIARELRKLPNVKISAKEFDGWASLAPEKQDVFLFTSETEGMPNIVLEAMSLGLPVVSTAVGGVPNSPAILVGRVNEDKADSWIEALLYAGSPFEKENRVKLGRDYVRNLHSSLVFDYVLKQAGYFDNLEDVNGSKDRGVGTERGEATKLDGAVEEAPR